MNKKYIDQDEVVRRLLISHRTLEKWRWKGIGPASRKIRGQIKYCLQDVEAFELNRTHCSMAGAAKKVL